MKKLLFILAIAISFTSCYPDGGPFEGTPEERQECYDQVRAIRDVLDPPILELLAIPEDEITEEQLLLLEELKAELLNEINSLPCVIELGLQIEDNS